MTKNKIDDFYTYTVKEECQRAYEVYLLSELAFMQDLESLGLNKKRLRQLIKEKLTGLKNALLNTDDKKSIFRILSHEFSEEIEEEKIKLTSFLYKLYNILVMTVYLNEKYLKKRDKTKLDKQLLSNNLAMSIIEGSVIGKEGMFMPYGSNRNGRGINQNLHAGGFYDAQNSYLRHLLLMLVVLYNRFDILPNIAHSKIGQKNIIMPDIENSSDTLPLNFLDEYHWYPSLIGTITNFDSIMTSLKKSNHRYFSLANIQFDKKFIDNFDFSELLKSYYFTSYRSPAKNPTESKIAETVGRIIGKEIQELTNKKRIWRHVVTIMKSFPHQVANQRNESIKFSEGRHIYIFNNNKKFGISPRGYGMRSSDSKKQTYKELQDKYKGVTDKSPLFEILRSKEYFINTYTF